MGAHRGEQPPAGEDDADASVEAVLDRTSVGRADPVSRVEQRAIQVQRDESVGPIMSSRTRKPAAEVEQETTVGRAIFRMYFKYTHKNNLSVNCGPIETGTRSLLGAGSFLKVHDSAMISL